MSRLINLTALTWLELILYERFGLSFELFFGDSYGLCVRLNGQGAAIEFQNGLVGADWVSSEISCVHWDAASEGYTPILGKPLPAPGAASLPSPLIEQAPTGYTIHYDILGLTYWMLTRQEEVGRTDLDQHGRFPASASHAFKHGYLERPVVDEWLDILGQVIQRTWPSVQLRQHQFSIKVSHDVDAPSRYGFCAWHKLPRGMAAEVLKHRDVRGFLAPWVRMRTRQRLHPLDGLNTFDWLMDVSEQHGLQSAFYFICDRRGTPYDSDYDLGHPAIRDLMRRIHARGHEIGLHPSYATFLEPDQIAHEANRLRRACAEEGIEQDGYGGRMHYLQWRQPVTLRAWDAAGMRYDSTMSYADHAGFRCGTCFEYPAFDPVAQQPLKLRIRPLVVMEGSVIGANYMNLGVSAAALDKMLELKKTCKAVGGCFTLLWHNSSLRSRAEKDLYQATVRGES